MLDTCFTQDVLVNKLACYLPFHPALVVGDVLRVEQFVGWRVFAEPMFRRRAGIHEGLSDDWQASVGDAALVDVEHKLRILNNIHPEPERKAAWTEKRDVFKKTFKQLWLYLIIFFKSTFLSNFLSPVALPGVSDVWVSYLSFVSLLV